MDHLIRFHVKTFGLRTKGVVSIELNLPPCYICIYMVELELKSLLHSLGAYAAADGEREVVQRSSRPVNDRRNAPDIYRGRTRNFIFSSEIVVSRFGYSIWR